MEKCYKKLVNFCNKLSDFDKNNIIVHKKIKGNKYLHDKLMAIEFLSLGLKNKILKDVKNVLYFKIKYDDCIIDIFYGSSNTRIPLKLLGGIVKRVSLLKKFGRSKKSRFLINVIPSRFKKNHKKNDNLCGDNVNSGASWIHSGEIFVWRKEELLKVITHELIHSFKYDNCLYKHSLNNTKFKFIKNRYMLNETYTELLAEFINLGLELDCVNYNVFKKMWENEVDFSICQTIRVMRILGFHSFNDMITTTWKQQTNIFNYYILRSAIMVYYNSFFKKFCNLKVNPSKFEIFAEKCFYSRKFKHIINNSSCSYSTSLRMTCHG
jgi:hypothetical protein